jgi:hypothetical protein
VKGVEEYQGRMKIPWEPRRVESFDLLIRRHLGTEPPKKRIKYFKKVLREFAVKTRFLSSGIQELSGSILPAGRQARLAPQNEF